MAQRIGAVILVALFLAGCSLVQPEPTQPSSRSNAATGAGAVPQRTAAPPPRRTAPRATLSDLIGTAPDRIDRLLGTPELVRREGAGELRLYRSKSCVLHVFLYPRNGTPVATHIEARTETARLDSPQTDRCIASFS
jgi:hypothetical protein